MVSHASWRAARSMFRLVSSWLKIAIFHQLVDVVRVEKRMVLTIQDGNCRAGSFVFFFAFMPGLM